VFSLAALAVLFAAFCYAALAISARKLAATESTLSLAVYVIVGPLVASSFTVRGHYLPPANADWLLFALAGLASAGAWIGIIGGYRRAAPSLLAPFEYTALIVGAIAGYWLWDEVPDSGVVAGGLIIIASGLFIVHREVASSTTGRYLRAVTAGAAASISKRFRTR
jgi:drug/metabolite transporter (DMT)-like permease